ncbi:MAG TPA: histidine kinase [Longimicrobiaceae bacterium]|nr:histidine kinase [Longimicrobiaceae bacterium]
MEFSLIAGASYTAIRVFPLGFVGPARWRRTGLLLLLGASVAMLAAFMEASMRAWAGVPPMGRVELFQQGFLLFAVFSAIGQILRGRGVIRHHELGALRMKASLAEAELSRAQAELRMLRREMNPHFMFNALQTVQALIVRDPPAAARAVVRLGDVLREALRRSEMQEIPLADEIELLRPFLEFEEMRMNGPLSLEWAVSDEALAAWVPHLVLQPLLENAVKHGIAPRGGGQIRVAAARREQWLEIEITDDGAGPRHDAGADGAGTGIGLANTRRRLHALYGDAQSFQISAAPNGGTAAGLRIPFHTAPLSRDDGGVAA